MATDQLVADNRRVGFAINTDADFRTVFNQSCAAAN